MKKMRKPPQRRHNKELAESLSKASGVSDNGIKHLSIELCQKLGIDWPLKWRNEK